MEELNIIIGLIMSLRPYPDLLLRAFRLMGALSITVDMHGYPVADPLPNGEKLWSVEDLHAEIDRQLDLEDATTKGFLVYLTEHKALWRVLPNLMEKE